MLVCFSSDFFVFAGILLIFTVHKYIVCRFEFVLELKEKIAEGSRPLSEWLWYRIPNKDNAFSMHFPSIDWNFTSSLNDVEQWRSTLMRNAFSQRPILSKRQHFSQMLFSFYGKWKTRVKHRPLAPAAHRTFVICIILLRQYIFIIHIIHIISFWCLRHDLQFQFAISSGWQINIWLRKWLLHVSIMVMSIFVIIKVVFASLSCRELI